MPKYINLFEYICSDPKEIHPNKRVMDHVNEYNSIVDKYTKLSTSIEEKYPDGIKRCNKCKACKQDYKKTLEIINPVRKDIQSIKDSYAYSLLAKNKTVLVDENYEIKTKKSNLLDFMIETIKIENNLLNRFSNKYDCNFEFCPKEESK